MYKNYTGKLGVRPPLYPKILLIMRLTFVILLASLLQVSASTFGQRITISKKNTSLEAVLKEIRRQSGFDIYYDGKIISSTQQIDIRVENVTVDQAVSSAIKGLDLTFEIERGSVTIIRKKAPSFVQHLIDKLSAIDIKGRILDEKGQPLVGVTVQTKGGGRIVKTGNDGGFILTDVAEGDRVVISYIGYERVELAVEPNFGDIRLRLSNTKLDEIQVIAYGETSRRLSTGNVSSVKAADIEKSPVNNPLLALAGRVPGIVITQVTGFAGSGVQVQIQGQNSIANGTIPFYVVDGVPYTQALLTPLSNIQGNSNSGISNPLSFINPQDIESIDVLKDADATAIYGSRASNGAILITTKKGRAGKTSVTLNLQSGYGEVAKKLKNLNTEQYLSLRKEAYESQGLAIPTLNSVRNNTNYDLTFWDQNRFTDWQEELIGGKARFTDMQGTISGGNENTQIIMGVNYHKETTVMPGEFSDDRIGAHLSLTQSSNDKRFKASMTASYLTDKNKLPGIDLTSAAVRIAPNAPALYDADGKLNWEVLPTGIETWTNPLRGILRTYNVSTNNLVANGEIGYRIWKSLSLKSTFGYTKLSNDETSLQPQSFFAPSVTANNRSSIFSSKTSSSWVIEPQLTYDMITKFGKFNFLVGTTFQRSNNYLMALNAVGFSNDSQLANINASTAVSVQNSIQDTANYAAAFGRLGYNLNDKYLLNITVRRDGSSRFGRENLFHNFYGIGAAWIFSSEQVIEKNIPFLSFGKLKVSYGTTGNDQIGNYSFLSLYTTPILEVPYGGGTSLAVNSLSNPYLQWEETTKFNVGIDLGFFSDKILLNANYYINRSSNQLTRFTLPITTGFNSISRNFPAVVRNSGVELLLNTQNIRGKRFQWSTSLNLSVPRNKLVRYDDLASSSYANTLVVGRSLSIWKTVKYLGVNPQTGRYNFERADGSVTESVGDRTLIVDRSPRYFGGLQNSFSYLGFSLDFLLQFTKQVGQDLNKFGFAPGSFSASGNTGNQPSFVLNNYWKQAEDIADFQRLNPGVAALNTPAGLAMNTINDANWVDASYIRLKNVSLSYSFPQRIAKAIKMQNVNVFVQAQNLFTLTGYKGLDPETLSSLTLPPLRVMTFGAKISL